MNCAMCMSYPCVCGAGMMGGVYGAPVMGMGLGVPMATTVVTPGIIGAPMMGVGVPMGMGMGLGMCPYCGFGPGMCVCVGRTFF